MKALIKKYPKRGIWMENVPEPHCGDNEILGIKKKLKILEKSRKKEKNWKEF